MGKSEKIRQVKNLLTKPTGGYQIKLDGKLIHTQHTHTKAGFTTINLIDG